MLLYYKLGGLASATSFLAVNNKVKLVSNMVSSSRGELTNLSADSHMRNYLIPSHVVLLYEELPRLFENK